MPKITSLQKSAIDIVDIIHFFNIYTGYNVFLTISDFAEEKKINNIFYEYVLNLIDQTIEKKNVPNKNIEFFKHYLLCGIEINLNKLNYDKLKSDHPNLPQLPPSLSSENAFKIQDHKSSFSTALLNSFLKKRNIDFELYTSTLYEIIKVLEQKEFPQSCYFRITLRALSYDFPVASLFVYKKFLDLGILKNARYKKINNSKYDELTEKIFLRSLLAIEFEIFRDFSKYYIKKDLSNGLIDLSEINFMKKDSFLSNDYRDNTIKYYKKTLERILNYYYYDKKESFYILESSKNKVDVNNFLNYAHDNYIHHSLFSNKQSNMTGVLGAQIIFYFQSRYTEKIAIYYEMDNSNTLSKKSSDFLKELGFTISPRTLYLHYKKLSNLQYEQVKLFDLTMHKSIGLTWNTPFHDLFMFSYQYNPHSN